ncbi:hypothetical protein [Spirosoma oryzicola]|uniref:hypothetical protein n=1 Tax=Spirosoma oryzicola TaxID=2898794 RepID=UPI001E43EA94|nr:hypothetical protein [Spirosoma oryzicola]UHG93336.1 hypothetical protein LQ777_10630 [Spirosoma oryzicola]
MDELEAELAAIIGTYRLQALTEYKYALQAAGIKITGELLDSFEATIRIDAARFVFECTIKFEEYGRFKDMKGLNTGDRMAPLEAIEYFVEKTGVDKFLNAIWADRYRTFNSRGKNKGPRPVSKLIRDIAWGVRIARYRDIRHLRKGRSWYNKTSGRLFIMTHERVRQAAALSALRHIKNTLEGKL